MFPYRKSLFTIDYPLTSLRERKRARIIGDIEHNAELICVKVLRRLRRRCQFVPMRRPFIPRPFKLTICAFNTTMPLI